MREAVRLSSIQNPLVRQWRELNKERAARAAQGLFLAEGEHMAGEALKEQKAAALLICADREERYEKLIAAARVQDLPLYILSQPVINALSDAKTPQGILALCALPKAPSLERMGEVVVALDDVQDPGNVGTILRTLDAAGFSGLIISKGCADPYAPKTLRASMGAVFRIPIAQTASLPNTLLELRQNGYAILAGALSGQPFYQRGQDQRRTCLVIGNEGSGISDEVLACATKLVRLPMHGGAESLNAAVACAIMLYDLLRVSETENAGSEPPQNAQ
jgi:TrmH family RNA methyltransferase